MFGGDIDDFSHIGMRDFLDLREAYAIANGITEKEEVGEEYFDALYEKFLGQPD